MALVESFSVTHADATVTGLAAAIASGEITPTQVLQAYIARIDAVEGRVQAWSYLDVEAALQEADGLTRDARAGHLRGPLHGVPIGVKDEFDVIDMPTYFSGDASPRTEDATPVARLRAAGAIILGKTHMPLGGGRMPPTRNPWNLEHTAGGSSSGSGAAVGARMVPVALGEQTGGSNLRPAAYCGVAGLKPTFGRVSRARMYPFSWSHDHPGVIGLTMADIALVFSVIGGPDPDDPTTRSARIPDSDLDADRLPPPRIGMVRNFFPERTEPVMLEAIERAAATLRTAGAVVQDVILPEEFGLVWPVHTLIGLAEGGTLHARRTAAAPEMSTGRDILANIVPASYYLQAQRIRGLLQRGLQPQFGDLHALLMGVAPGPAPAGLGSTGDATLLGPWSCLGYPAITVNAGVSPEGLPLGLQFVGAPNADEELLKAGAWCEQALGRLPPPVL